MKKSSDQSRHWQVIFDWRVSNIDILRLDPQIKQRIGKTIKVRLQVDPFLYGLPLRGKLKKFWKLRVGDWRVIYDVSGTKIRVFAIANRRDVYQIMVARIS